MAMDLAGLLVPMDVDTFLAEYWERQPLVLRRNSPEAVSPLLSLGDIDDILQCSSLRADDISIVSDGKATAATQLLTRPQTNASEGGLEAVYQEYRKGASLIFRFLHERSLPLKRLCQAVAADLSCRVQVNVYLTPRGARGFKRHYDTHDVFVLQAYGRKSWKICEPEVKLPLADRHYPPDQGAAPSDALLEEVTLERGDLMYIPRGYPHSGKSLEEASLHLTVGLLPITWGSLLMQAVNSAIDAELDLRRALPPGFARDPRVQEDTAARMHELLRHLPTSIDVEREVEEACTRARIGRQPTLSGHLLDLEEVPDLGPGTVIRCRKDAQAVLTETEDRVCVTFYGKNVQLPRRAARAVRFMLETDQFTPAQLPGSLDEPSKILLASRFVTEGLLTVDRDAQSDPRLSG